MHKAWGGILVVTGFVACPCHFPLTLPLLLGLLGGTGVGGFVAANQGWLYGIATGYFIAALVVGFLLLSRRRRAAGGTACDITPRSSAQARGSSRGRRT